MFFFMYMLLKCQNFLTSVHIMLILYCVINCSLYMILTCKLSSFGIRLSVLIHSKLTKISENLSVLGLVGNFMRLGPTAWELAQGWPSINPVRGRSFRKTKSRNVFWNIEASANASAIIFKNNISWPRRLFCKIHENSYFISLLFCNWLTYCNNNW